MRSTLSKRGFIVLCTIILFSFFAGVFNPVGFSTPVYADESGEPQQYGETRMTGTLTPLHGTVMVESPSGTEILSGPVSVQAGVTITTEAESVAMLVFDDGTSIRISPSTVISINDDQGMAYLKQNGVPGAAVSSLSFVLERGEINGALASWSEGDPSAEDSQMVAEQDAPWWLTPQEKRVRLEVDMPWGVAGIRGTFFHCKVADDGSSKVDLLTGSAVVKSKGKSVELHGGEKADILSRGKVVKALSGEEENKQWTLPEVSSWSLSTAKLIDKNFPAKSAKVEKNEEKQVEDENKTETEKTNGNGKVTKFINESLKKAAAAADKAAKEKKDKEATVATIDGTGNGNGNSGNNGSSGNSGSSGGSSGSSGGNSGSSGGSSGNSGGNSGSGGSSGNSGGSSGSSGGSSGNSGGNSGSSGGNSSGGNGGGNAGGNSGSSGGNSSGGNGGGNAGGNSGGNGGGNSGGNSSS